MDKELETIHAKLAALEAEVVNLRQGYVIVNKRYNEALKFAEITDSPCYRSREESRSIGRQVGACVQAFSVRGKGGGRKARDRRSRGRGSGCRGGGGSSSRIRCCCCRCCCCGSRGDGALCRGRIAAGLGASGPGGQSGNGGRSRGGKNGPPRCRVCAVVAAIASCANADARTASWCSCEQMVAPSPENMDTQR